jgi:hypothetical protein
MLAADPKQPLKSKAAASKAGQCRLHTNAVSPPNIRSAILILEDNKNILAGIQGQSSNRPVAI